MVPTLGTWKLSYLSSSVATRTLSVSVTAATVMISSMIFRGDTGVLRSFLILFFRLRFMVVACSVLVYVVWGVVYVFLGLFLWVW